MWRSKTVDPRPEYQLKPPKRNHTILTELTTIKAYFAFLLRKGYISREPDFASIQRESMKVNRRDFLSLTQYTQTLNTVRKWYKSKSTTPTQKYNREMIYLCLLIMANSALRKGELKGLKWGDLEPNTNLDKEDHEVDAISGATITGDGVTDMIKERLQNYLSFFNSNNESIAYKN